MTMLSRLSPDINPEVALIQKEIKLIDAINNNKNNMSNNCTKIKNLPYYLNKIAILGGYMNRTSDPPHGNIIMWRGLSRLTDMRIGFNFGTKMTCG